MEKERVEIYTERNLLLAKINNISAKIKAESEAFEEIKAELAANQITHHHVKILSFEHSWPGRKWEGWNYS